MGAGLSARSEPVPIFLFTSGSLQCRMGYELRGTRPGELSQRRSSFFMATINIHGQENIIAPAFYMPNRLSVQACKSLHYLLQGRLCYITDPLFPPQPDVEQYIASKGLSIEHFDFRNGTPQAAKARIRGVLQSGKSVIFLPGKLPKVRGCLTDVPKLYL